MLHNWALSHNVHNNEPVQEEHTSVVWRRHLFAIVTIATATAGFIAFITGGLLSSNRADTIDSHHVSVNELLDDANNRTLTSATVNGDTVTATTSSGTTITATVPTAYLDTTVTALINANVAVNPEGTATTDTSSPDTRTSATATGTPSSAVSSWLLACGGIVMLAAAVAAVWRVMTRSPLLHHDTVDTTTRTGGAADAVDIPTTRFTDVAGAAEATEQLQELVSFLQHPDRYDALGAKHPSGALLVGPPGTGKTLLARAVAGEANVPFYHANASDFIEVFVGKGAARVRELYRKARRHDKALIFIDEIDAIGKQRSAHGEPADSERDTTLLALLTEIDGFEQSNVITISATNRPDILDKALTRPGRLSKHIHVPLPDLRGRRKILDVHLRGKPVSGDLRLDDIAAATPGFSGADLEAVVNEAATSAARTNQDAITAAALSSAVATVAMGVPRTSALVSDRERRITAWHEAGHTLAALAEKDAMTPLSVSIIPRGPAGGVTWFADTDEAFLARQSAWARLTVHLGGREAERLHMDGDFTSGASSDLASATSTATAMLTQYGMEHTLSVGADAADPGVRADVERILARAGRRAAQLLTEYRPVLDALAEALLEKESLDRQEIVEVLMSTRCQSLPAFQNTVVDTFGRPAPTPGWLDAVSTATPAPSNA